MEVHNDLEQVAQVSLKIFSSLPKTGKPGANEWTVLSCIIKEENSKFEAVALGTGSKCIGRTKMSSKGDILNDSHAEIICRRAYLIYLYDQIYNCLKSEPSIFVCDKSSFKFSMRNVKFHFFTTLMPCGDASIFSKNSLNMNIGDLVKNEQSEERTAMKRSLDYEDSSCKKFKRNSEDIFRTGAKCLIGDEKQDPHKEGVGYHITGVVRTKPGRGDPTLSVSCSDKLAKWCHLGIQGALLSILLKENIFLSTFTVASNTPFSEESLRRAFQERLDDVQMISPYRKNIPKFYQAKGSDFVFQKAEQKDVCPSSIIWFRSENLEGKPLEVAIDGKKQGVTKKNRDLETSRLKICKAEMFSRFLKVYNNFSEEFSELTYQQCKEKAELYQQNWQILKQSFGVWPEKEKSLANFNCHKS